MGTKFEKNANETTYEINSYRICKMERVLVILRNSFSRNKKGYRLHHHKLKYIKHQTFKSNSKVMFCIIVNVIYILYLY